MDLEDLNRQLLEAAYAGNTDAILMLLDNGAYINCLHTGHATPIYLATASRHLAAVELLMSRGADINIPTIYGLTPFYVASQNCYPEIGTVLLNAGADVSVLKGPTPIYAAISTGCVEMVKMNLAAGADIVAEEKHGEFQTPVRMAAFLQGTKTEAQYQEIYTLVMDAYYKWLDHFWSFIEADLKVDQDKTFEVVVSRYKEDVSWVAKEFRTEQKITIYNKGPDDLGELPADWKIVNIPNLGYLGGTFLYHIVNNYEHLADRTLFLQGDPYDAGIFLPIITYKSNLTSTCNNIIAKCENTTLFEASDYLDQWFKIVLPNSKYADFSVPNYTMIEFVHQYIDPDYPIESTVNFVWGAEFAVDKDKILSRPKKVYEAMLLVFNKTKPAEDFFLEELWDPLFQPSIKELNGLSFDNAEQAT